MKLQVFLSLLFTATAFIATGVFAYTRPSHFGGDFRLVSFRKNKSIKHFITRNDFVIKNTKLIGACMVFAGILELFLAVTYLFYPDILLIFTLAK